MKYLFLINFLLLLFTECPAQLVVYPAPSADFSKKSNKYLVSVTQNGVTKQSFVYKSTAGDGSGGELGNEKNNNFHFTVFSFSGQVKVSVSKLNSAAGSATIRPNRLAIGNLKTTNQNSNAEVNFNLTKPAKVSVEFDDDPSHIDALMIFADTLETGVPDMSAANIFVPDSQGMSNMPAGKTVVYFKPGIYSMGYWEIPASIKQVYIAGGAYIKGYFNRKKKDSGASGAITINGRGIISNEGYPFHYPSNASDQHSANWYFPIRINGGRMNKIEGITIIEATGFNILMDANNSLIENVNINGFRYNNDGITIKGSGNKIDNCFIRSNDDGIVPYASNLTISNCVFWQLQGAVIQFGWTPHTMSNITITDCDVLHDKATSSEGDVGFINAMNARPAAAPSLINNVNVSNIYFDTPVLRFLDIRNGKGFKHDGRPGAGDPPWIYTGFSFSNIHFSQGTNKYPLIYLDGFDDNHQLANYSFQNIYFNNLKISGSKMSDSNFFYKKRVKQLLFK